MMTAPLRIGEPTTVNVALGSRAYDIVIGRGLIATLGQIQSLRVTASGSAARFKGSTAAGDEIAAVAPCLP